MKYLFRFLSITTVGLAIITSPQIALAQNASPANSTLFSRQIGPPGFHLAMQSYSMPPHRTFESILHRDALGWFSDRYVIDSLGDVTLLDGSLSSGTWSAEGSYYYISGFDEQQHTGWVIFRFRDGYIDCLVYHNFQRTCRRPNGY